MLKKLLNSCLDAYRGSHRSLPNYDANANIYVDAGTVAPGDSFYYTPPRDGYLVMLGTNNGTIRHFEAKLGSMAGPIIGASDTAAANFWSVGTVPVQKGRTVCVSNFSAEASGLRLELHPYIGS